MKILLILLLIGVANGIRIGCRFSSIGFSIIGTQYTCSVTSLNFSDNSTHITGYTGAHLSGNSALNVRAVTFDNCIQLNLATFPRGFATIFPNIIALRFLGCVYDTLRGDELEDYPNLQYFRSWPGNLTRIPGNLFTRNPNLRFLCFDNNRIRHVGEGLLDHLRNLTTIHFSNPCLSRSLSNPSQLPSFIQALRINCPDIVTTTLATTTTTLLTTTTTVLTSTSTQPPICEIENLEEFVCELDVENQSLRERVENLEECNGNLKAENDEIRWKLVEIERKLLDLSSRPCAC